MKGKVYAIDHGLAFVKLHDGGICWIEAMTGDLKINDVLCGDFGTNGRRQTNNETEGRPTSVLVQGHI